MAHIIKGIATQFKSVNYQTIQFVEAFYSKDVYDFFLGNIILQTYSLLHFPLIQHSKLMQVYRCSTIFKKIWNSNQSHKTWKYRNSASCWCTPHSICNLNFLLMNSPHHLNELVLKFLLQKKSNFCNCVRAFNRISFFT